MADDAASSSPVAASMTEEAAASRLVVEEATTDDDNSVNPHPAISGGDAVPLNGKRKRGDTDDCLPKPDSECDEKKVRIDEPVPVPSGSGLLARRAGFVPHLKVHVPEYKLRHFLYDSDCEST
ncbi:unnamed protein product [Urochloa humidicola]